MWRYAKIRHMCFPFTLNLVLVPFEDIASELIQQKPVLILPSAERTRIIIFTKLFVDRSENVPVKPMKC